MRRASVYPMPETDIVGLRDAAERAGVSHEAVRKWCDKHAGLGQFKDGVWIINRTALDAIIRARKTLQGAG